MWSAARGSTGLEAAGGPSPAPHRLLAAASLVDTPLGPGAPYRVYVTLDEWGGLSCSANRPSVIELNFGSLSPVRCLTPA
jgi:hypothetical protein